jgi:hypothetical protein
LWAPEEGEDIDTLCDKKLGLIAALVVAPADKVSAFMASLRLLAPELAMSDGAQGCLWVARLYGLRSGQSSAYPGSRARVKSCCRPVAADEVGGKEDVSRRPCRDVPKESWDIKIEK